ncbi:MAG: dephospho-CoA kinase [Sediminibacterium sp.]|nr:dephospho-CoA kinase [Sediminibacterium sp.]
MSIIIGLTGGIGSGKSTVAKIFAQLGIPVLDADATAKAIMNEDHSVKTKLIELFGEDAYKENQLNRPYIAQLVFEDAFKLQQLNAIIHPITIQYAKDWAFKQSAPYVIKEAALFFESGSSEGVEKIIGVTAPKHIRIQRVMQRDQITREDVIKRMEHQLEDSLKMKLCDWVIQNDDMHLLIPQILAIHQSLTIL